MTHEELLDLLREAQEWIRDHRCEGDDGQCLCNRYDLEYRIDAMLKEEERRAARICSCGRPIDFLHAQLGVNLCGPCLAKEAR
jgi:hypothetical protein